MSEIQMTQSIMLIRIGNFQIKFEKVTQEGGVELLKKWLSQEKEEKRDKGIEII